MMEVLFLSDQSDVDLRHSMANMLAVVMGSPPRSNHLWYHLFAADKLQRTYMTGFMVSSMSTPYHHLPHSHVAAS